MKRNKNKKTFLIVMSLLFLSIGFAFLTTDLSISGISFIKQNTWDVHFANVVDDSFSSEVNNPATISSNGKKVNFEVTFNNPGEEYYFYVDVVNDGTLDAMLDLYEVTGLSEEQKNYIEWEITYSDGIELTKYDKLPKDSKDTLKVLVRFKDNIDISVLPDNNEAINLTFKSIYVQADKSAKERTTVEDRAAPDINFAAQSSQSIKGNNKWYKSLSVLSKLVDPSGIKSIKYCATTSDTCTPDQTADIKNNSISLQLSNNALGQTVCVEGIDVKDNNDVVCSKEKYYVDGEDPVINSIEVTPDDLSIRVEVNAKDTYSGVSKYYYSKDGGRSYISSNNNNYTFVNLEPNDYLVVSNVEDAAGNTSISQNKAVNVRNKTWCENNNISNLSDCIIATETGIPNIEEAKQAIIEKSSNELTKPNFHKTSPSFIYSQKPANDYSIYSITDRYVYIGKGYEYDTNTGYFTLTDRKNILVSNIDYDFSKDNYYLCNKTDFFNGSNCTTLYKINSISKTEDVFNIKKLNIESEIKEYNTSDSGLFATIDDYKANSFYYRGIVAGNFIKFADKIWKIVRINGNGTIRIMYYGTNTNSSSPAFMSEFNSRSMDPTFVGFMNNPNEFSTVEQESDTIGYNLSTNTNYYYGKKYTYDAETKKYKLVGTVEDNELLFGKWEELHNSIISDGYIYTCWSSNIDGTCEALSKINGYQDNNHAKVTYKHYGSTSYNNAIKNVEKSTIMTKLEEWYENNISNNEQGKYVVDSVFCNDRSISKTSNSDGFSYVPNVEYGPMYRLVNAVPSLVCPETNDMFTLTTSSLGNRLMKYPIGLLTSDEVIFAGGRYLQDNSMYYMKYGNVNTTLISPGIFNSPSASANLISLYNNGMLYPWPQAAYSNQEIRPVISIDPTLFKFSGTGSNTDPFIVIEKED